MYVWAGRDTFVVLNSVSVVLFIILQSLDRIPYTLSALPTQTPGRIQKVDPSRGFL